MGKKLIEIIIGILVVILLLPSITGAATLEIKREVIKDCYIEATGPVVPVSGNLFQYLFFKRFCIRPFGDDRAFIFSAYIEWNEPEVTVTIYAEKNGEILWQDPGDIGQWGTRLFWYYGIYTDEVTTEDQLIVNFKGNAKVVIVSTGE
ncbi:hypothetical protein AYK25_01580 [Thermoplasmatales archaeon SM1-50]|nr:MAG: hypothetical protein AYK25_01580 [Thermoplasmatales archaeon SM1-50]